MAGFGEEEEEDCTSASQLLPPVSLGARIVRVDSEIPDDDFERLTSSVPILALKKGILIPFLLLYVQNVTASDL